MTVLGIDPSHVESAFVFWDGSRVIDCGKLPNDEVRDLLCGSSRYDLVAVEVPTLFGKRVYPEILEGAIQAGAFWGIGAVALRSVRYSRQQTSLHCSGDRSCKYAHLKNCLIERFGPVGTKKSPGPLYGLSGEDMWDALAVAVTAYDKAVEDGGAG